MYHQYLFQIFEEKHRNRKNFLFLIFDKFTCLCISYRRLDYFFKRNHIFSLGFLCILHIYYLENVLKNKETSFYKSLETSKMI